VFGSILHFSDLLCESFLCFTSIYSCVFQYIDLFLLLRCCYCLRTFSLIIINCVCWWQKVILCNWQTAGWMVGVLFTVQANTHLPSEHDLFQVKQSEHEAGHWLLCSAALYNVWSLPPHHLYISCHFQPPLWQMFCILTGIVIAPADCEKAILVPQIVNVKFVLTLTIWWGQWSMVPRGKLCRCREQWGQVCTSTGCCKNRGRLAYRFDLMPSLSTALEVTISTFLWRYWVQIQVQRPATVTVVITPVP
jgi:hypothetical protein